MLFTFSAPEPNDSGVHSVIELEDLETLGEDALSSWPQEAVGQRLTGWVVTPGGTVHSSQIEAELYVEQLVSHPIQWHNPFPDRDPTPGIFGAHPLIVAHWKTIGHLQPGCSNSWQTDEMREKADRERDKIQREIGQIAYAQWVISPEHEPIFGPMKNVVLPHPFSRYFARETSSGTWEVWEYSPFSKETYFAKRVASQSEAVIAAGLADYTHEARRLGIRELPSQNQYWNAKMWAMVVAALMAGAAGLTAII